MHEAEITPEKPLYQATGADDSADFRYVATQPRRILSIRPADQQPCLLAHAGD